MADKNKESTVFREKNIDKVSGPESLNDYIKVTTPSVWVVLISLVLLLLGIFAWSIFGRIETHEADGSTLEVAPISYVTN